jgi:Trk K+ transport system NAD-binding subunit
VPFNARTYDLYHHFCQRLRRYERGPRLAEEQPVDLGDCRTLILGMGRVGVGAYEYLTEKYGHTVIGIEENQAQLQRVREMGIRVVQGDATDEDFWESLPLERIDLIMVSLTKHAENKAVCELLKTMGYHRYLAVIARYPDQRRELRELGCIAFNLYQEAGFGFAEHVHQRITGKEEEAFSVAHFT